MTLGPVRVMGAGVVGKHYVEEVNIHSCTVLFVRKPTEISHLANCILLCQLIARFIHYRALLH